MPYFVIDFTITQSAKAFIFLIPRKVIISVMFINHIFFENMNHLLHFGLQGFISSPPLFFFFC